MNNRPDGANLLAIARETFIEQVLPALPERLRYTGLMIANAMAIARREIEAGEVPAQQELERLQQLCAERLQEFSGGALYAALIGYNRRLARDDPRRAVRRARTRCAARPSDQNNRGQARDGQPQGAQALRPAGCARPQ